MVATIMVAGCVDGSSEHDFSENPFVGEEVTGNGCTLGLFRGSGGGGSLALEWAAFEQIAPQIAQAVNESLPAENSTYTPVVGVTCSVLRGSEGEALLDAFEDAPGTEPRNSHREPMYHLYGCQLVDESRGLSHYFELALVIVDPERVG